MGFSCLLDLFCLGFDVSENFRRSMLPLADVFAIRVEAFAMLDRLLHLFDQSRSSRSEAAS